MKIIGKEPQTVYYYKESDKLGKGGFGDVYKCYIFNEGF